MSDRADSDQRPDLLRRCMVRAKLENVCTLLKAVRKELHLEKAGERELLGVIEHARDQLRDAGLRCFPLREALRQGPLVNPCCSSNVRYPMNGDRPGYTCGHCEQTFTELVPGCPLHPVGLHDETWMYDGVCACGADGSQSC